MHIYTFWDLKICICKFQNVLLGGFGHLATLHMALWLSILFEAPDPHS